MTEVPVIQAWGLAFRSSEPVLNLGVMESICNPNAREEETGRSLKFIGQPGWISELQAQWESLSQKIKVESDWGTTLDIDICPPHTREHIHICSWMYPWTLHMQANRYLHHHQKERFTGTFSVVARRLLSSDCCSFLLLYWGWEICTEVCVAHRFGGPGVWCWYPLCPRILL